MTDPALPRTLDGGLTLRRAVPADEEQIVRLSLDAHGEFEAWGLRHVTARHGIDAWTVVCDDDRVVSTCLLLRHELELGDPDGVSVRLPAGQVEYVATDPAYQRRGLVRAQFDVHHRAADERGDLVVLVAGIPYFYRHLGYAYGVSYPTVYRAPRELPTPPAGWAMRRAELDDLPAVQRLHDRALASAGLRLRRTGAEWQDVVDDRATANGLYVVHVDGDVRGWMRFFSYTDDGVSLVVQAGSTDLDAATALVHHASELAGHTRLLLIDRHGDPLHALLASIAHPDVDGFNAIYTRVADPLALLEALRPVLDDRLARSELAGFDGELLMSLYTRSIRLVVRGGAVEAIEWAEGVEDPDGEAAIGVAPDALPALLLGRFGASGLAARVDDVVLGRHRRLADVLFPPLVADVVGLV